MDIKISINEYTIVKDGVIIGIEGDPICISFEDLKFTFKILDEADTNKTDFNPIVSDNKKSIDIPIQIQWSNLVTTFSKKLDMAVYYEADEKKQLSMAYAITGLKGDSFKSYIFRYTIYSRNFKNG